MAAVLNGKARETLVAIMVLAVFGGGGAWFGTTKIEDVEEQLRRELGTYAQYQGEAMTRLSADIRRIEERLSALDDDKLDNVIALDRYTRLLEQLTELRQRIERLERMERGRGYPQ